MPRMVCCALFVLLPLTEKKLTKKNNTELLVAHSLTLASEFSQSQATATERAESTGVRLTKILFVAKKVY